MKATIYTKQKFIAIGKRHNHRRHIFYTEPDAGHILCFIDENGFGDMCNEEAVVHGLLIVTEGLSESQQDELVSALNNQHIDIINLVEDIFEIEPARS